MITIIAEAQTEYNRKARQWQVFNGKLIATFPPGPDGKRRAQLEALEINRPDLAALVHKVASSNQDPKAMNMAIKAAQILIGKLLYRDGVCHSQSRPGLIHIITFDGCPCVYHCTCEAFSHCPIYIEGIGFLCKHCLADHWAYILGEGLERAAWPDDDDAIDSHWDYNDELIAAAD